jgi:hypothetical protein
MAIDNTLNLKSFNLSLAAHAWCNENNIECEIILDRNEIYVFNFKSPEDAMACKLRWQ